MPPETRARLCVAQSVLRVTETSDVVAIAVPHHVNAMGVDVVHVLLDPRHARGRRDPPVSANSKGSSPLTFQMAEYVSRVANTSVRGTQYLRVLSAWCEAPTHLVGHAQAVFYF
jgi:hypothetical protein